MSMTPTPFFKNCPIQGCPSVQYYGSKYALKTAAELNRICMNCVRKLNHHHNKKSSVPAPIIKVNNKPLLKKQKVVEEIVITNKRQNKTFEEVNQNWFHAYHSGTLEPKMRSFLEMHNFDFENGTGFWGVYNNKNKPSGYMDW